jgi:hypothetical protein
MAMNKEPSDLQVMLMAIPAALAIYVLLWVAMAIF